MTCKDDPTSGGFTRRDYPQVSRPKPVQTGRRFLVAAGIAAAFSGVPSTAWSLAVGADPLAAARAAGNLFLPAGSSPRRLLAAGAVAHAGVSLFWTGILGVVLPRRRPILCGALAGAAIAALDLGIVARLAPVPLIRELPVGPQVADHVAFGVLAAAVLARGRAEG